MAYLLDTHTLLWYIQGDSKLSEKASQTISDGKAEIIVNIVSLWEIAIKSNVGKLKIEDNISQIKNDIDAYGFKLWGINVEILDIYQKLTLHHRDPFDRILIAHALFYQQEIVSADAQFDAYSVGRIW